MIACVRFYLSTFSAGRNSSVAKKPYNPIQGEFFQCFWTHRAFPTVQKPPVKVSANYTRFLSQSFLSQLFQTKSTYVYSSSLSFGKKIPNLVYAGAVLDVVICIIWIFRRHLL